MSELQDQLDEVMEGTTLVDIIEAQHMLQVTSFELNLRDMPDEERMEAIRWNVLALTDELHEVLQETGWKPWASSNHVNEEAALKEMVDALHFFANLCLLLGISGVDLARGYFRKREVNAQRQRDGYTGLNKCPVCRRSFDDVGSVTRDNGDGPFKLCITCHNAVRNTEENL